MKQYNLVSVCNKQYTPFLKVFLGSALNILDSEKLNKIYILDTGGERKTKDFFSSIDYIEFIDYIDYIDNKDHVDHIFVCYSL